MQAFVFDRPHSGFESCCVFSWNPPLIPLHSFAWGRTQCQLYGKVDTARHQWVTITVMHFNYFQFVSKLIIKK